MYPESTSSPTLVSIGEVLIDFVPSGDRMVYEARLGGAPANIAIIARAFGVQSSLISRVGKDWLGDMIVRALAERGLDMSQLSRSSFNTSVAVVSPHGGPPDFLLYRQGSAEAQMVLTADELDHIVDADAVHLSSLLPSTSVGRDLVRRIVDRRPPGLVSYDVNLRPTAWYSSRPMHEWALRMIGLADIIKVTEDELRQLGWRTSPDNVAESLWLVTNGHRGARLISSRWELRAVPPRVKAVDSTGAGDATLASLLASILQSGAHPLSLPEAQGQEFLNRAVRTGAEAVQHFGATEWVPTRSAAFSVEARP